MRKITEQIVEAFLNGEHRKIGNTETDGERILLHGNKIVERDVTSGAIWFTLAGWNTPTTRERVNGLINAVKSDNGGTVYQKNFEAMRDGVVIDSYEWYLV